MRKSSRARPLRAALALVLAASLAGTAFAAGMDGENGGPGTDVWISVVPRPTAERISVTVPVALGFVVDGTADKNDAAVVSSENGNVLLPNVRVQDAGDDGYQLVTVGASSIVVRNYSTTVPDENLDDANPPRYGMRVALSAAAVDEGEDGAQDGWRLTGSVPSQDETGYKAYRLSLDGHAFSLPAEDGFAMEGDVTIGAAPAHEYGWTASGMSNVPFEQEISLGVEAGGTRGMYHTAENSAKVARIVWSLKGLPLERPLPAAEQSLETE